MTRAYELMVIFESDLDESSVSAQVKKIGQTIEAGEGTVATTDVWGLRRFAYEINHKSEGIYVVLEIVTEAPNLDVLDRQLRLADEVVRHKILRLPEREATRRGLLGDAPAEDAAEAAPEAEPAPADAG
ncbi:MAG: 30S ribosomal protein S6 [Acidimicrobiales bacterium]|nr:30S ribosomal protein S6 [Acidimicrobiales bacterium]